MGATEHGGRVDLAAAGIGTTDRIRVGAKHCFTAAALLAGVGVLGVVKNRPITIDASVLETGSEAVDVRHWGVRSSAQPRPYEISGRLLASKTAPLRWGGSSTCAPLISSRPGAESFPLVYFVAYPDVFRRAVAENRFVGGLYFGLDGHSSASYAAAACGVPGQRYILYGPDRDPDPMMRRFAAWLIAGASALALLGTVALLIAARRRRFHFRPS